MLLITLVLLWLSLLIPVQLNDTGKYTADQMTKIAKSILAMGDAGLDTKAALADFSRLANDPIKAPASLNQQYGFVDEAMMKHLITSRKRRGKQQRQTKL
ncbi:hypothetical protein EIN43_06140 [Enterobacter hormaechei]|uniref:Bacteriophage tail tape measure N-terminal domain-containing protein n=1 Tax=Enterobacter hormaechei TaxID=158836 RepID=A0A4Y5ZV69_9ENTR|nr:hypothetical protein EIN43_06140 [Enterobacter hormaechei]